MKTIIRYVYLLNKIIFFTNLITQPNLCGVDANPEFLFLWIWPSFLAFKHVAADSPIPIKLNIHNHFWDWRKNSLYIFCDWVEFNKQDLNAFLPSSPFQGFPNQLLPANRGGVVQLFADNLPQVTLRPPGERLFKYLREISKRIKFHGAPRISP